MSTERPRSRLCLLRITFPKAGHGLFAFGQVSPADKSHCGPGLQSLPGGFGVAELRRWPTLQYLLMST